MSFAMCLIWIGICCSDLFGAMACNGLNELEECFHFYLPMYLVRRAGPALRYRSIVPHPIFDHRRSRVKRIDFENMLE